MLKSKYTLVEGEPEQVSLKQVRISAEGNKLLSEWVQDNVFDIAQKCYSQGKNVIIFEGLHEEENNPSTYTLVLLESPVKMDYFPIGSGNEKRIPLEPNDPAGISKMRVVPTEFSEEESKPKKKVKRKRKKL